MSTSSEVNLRLRHHDCGYYRQLKMKETFLKKTSVMVPNITLEKELFLFFLSEFHDFSCKIRLSTSERTLF